MESYESGVTSYLMAASEGVLRMREEVSDLGISNDNDVPELKNIVQTHRKYSDRYWQPERVDSCDWPGNWDSPIFMPEEMLDHFRKWVKNPTNTGFVDLFDQCEEILLRAFHDLTTMDGVKPADFWHEVPPSSYEHHVWDPFTDVVAKEILPHQIKGWTDYAIAKTVIWMRVMYAARKAVGPMSAKKIVSETECSMQDGIRKYKDLVKDHKKFAEVFRESTPSKRMFLSDLREFKDRQDIEEKMVVSARNRILLHLMGAGGFIVSTGGRKFEVSSRGDGCTGLYYREFVLAESFTKAQSEETGRTFEASVEVGYLMFGFSASVEVSKSRTYGWAITTQENPTEWKRIKEKSFLDGLGTGSATLGRLVLLMNWYVGGFDEWFTTSKAVEYGSLMKEKPMQLEKLFYLEGFKVDTPFRKGELASVIQGSGDLSITPFHAVSQSRIHGMTRYERTGQYTKKKLTGFSVEDAKVCLGMNDTMRSEKVC